MHEYNLHKYADDYDKKPCEKCGSKKRPTEHHVWPRRFSFSHDKQDLCVWLCFFCHGDLEAIINQHERQFGGKLPNWFYPHVTLDFITK